MSVIFFCWVIATSVGLFIILELQYCQLKYFFLQFKFKKSVIHYTFYGFVCAYNNGGHCVNDSPTHTHAHTPPHMLTSLHDYHHHVVEIVVVVKASEASTSLYIITSTGNKIRDSAKIIGGKP